MNIIYNTIVYVIILIIKLHNQPPVASFPGICCALLCVKQRSAQNKICNFLSREIKHTPASSILLHHQQRFSSSHILLFFQTDVLVKLPFSDFSELH